jgi:3-oxoacyl-[acyl-carrier-protein] synthase III
MIHCHRAERDKNMAKAKIIGTGMYAPGPPIDNDQLEKLAGIEFNKEKIASKIGIKQRHIARLSGVDESGSDFATKAALAAIKNAEIDPLQVNLFIVGSDTPDYISPGTSVLVQGRIQNKEMDTGAFDINASCASFVSAFDAASRMMASDATLQYAVIIGLYNMPAFIRPGDQFSYPIFADGAGAIVLKRTDDDDPSGYLTGQLMADGTQWDYVGVYAGGTKRQLTHEMLDKGEYGLQSLKPLPGDRNIRLWPPLVYRLLDKAGLKVSDIDHFIFTQINHWVITEVMKVLGEPMEKTTTIMDRYGYTGSGCVPMALHEAITTGKIKRGNKVLFVASGAGLAVGSNVFVY